MAKLQMIVNTIGGVILGVCTYIFGGLDKIFLILLTVIVIDYITGLCRAIINKKLNSMIGIKGIIKKIGYLLIVAVSVVIDSMTNTPNVVRSLVINFFIVNEIISIVENWGQIGMPLPDKLLQVLEQLKGGEQDGKN